MTNTGKPSDATGARAAGGARPAAAIRQPSMAARAGALCALAAVGFALMARVGLAEWDRQGMGGLLEPLWVGLLSTKITFWRLLAMQAGVVVAGASLAVWRWHAQRGTGSVPSAQEPHGLRAPRATFLRTLEQIVAGRDERPYSLILFDIDGFRILNDQHGAEVADALLARVKRHLAATLPNDARMARFGSDEFLAFVPTANMSQALDLARRVLDTTARLRFPAGEGRFGVTMSAGLASFPETCHSLRDAISQATSALQEAKDQGRATVIPARPNNIGLCRLGAEVESALNDRRVHPAYQPIIDLRTGRPVAEEGLARILLPQGQVLGADQFMGAATDLRLASRIDESLIGQTLDRCRKQSRRGDTRLRFINVSAALLQERRLLEQIALSFTGCDILNDLTGSRNPLVVEITERELLRDPAAALQALQPLLGIGARLAIDDFGSGYSSFLYLTALPISFLKIEMTLLKTARTSGRARAILKGIQGIAKDLNILTIAEGIEDEELAGVARDHGMDWGQGFYFGRPALDVTPASVDISGKVS